MMLSISFNSVQFLYLAGTMTFCMYELAKNTIIQQKLYEEINGVLQKYDGNLNYESLSEMKYLDACIDGT